MRIESSVTGMESERSFSAVNYSARSFKTTRLTQAGIQGQGSYGGSSFLNTLLGKYDGQEDLKNSETSEDEKKAGADSPTAIDIMNDMKTTSVSDVASKSEETVTDYYARHMSLLYIFSLLFEEFRQRIDELMGGLTSDYEDYCKGGSSEILNTPMYHASYVQRDYYMESESTSFSAKGKAVCADGRMIEYDIDVSMSRSFKEYAEKNLGLSFDVCIDPLVINLGSSDVSISDQKFYFDLDADGKEELISMPSGGSGFIALDKNGDGKVNDGSELFGTSSGNGFEDLAAFDDDKDGWIDEDDDIFDRLKVWIKEEDGSDKLFSFKEAGIGAINLTNTDTEFSVKDEANRASAIVRKSGMFLYEDGRAGIVRQIDMVS